MLAPSAGLLFAAVLLGTWASLDRLVRLFFEAMGLDKGVASKLFVFPEWINGSSKKRNMAENEQDVHSEGDKSQSQSEGEGLEALTEEQMSVKALSKFADEVLIDAYIHAQDAEVQDGKRGSSLLNFIISITRRTTSRAGDAVVGLGIELSPMRHSNERSRSGTLAQAVLFQNQRLGGGASYRGSEVEEGLDVIPNPLRIPAATMSEKRRADFEAVTNPLAELADKPPTRLDPSFPQSALPAVSSPTPTQQEV